MEKVKTISPHCRVCKGECWHPESQKKTQEEAMKKFGIIPNDCVVGQGNVVRCPAALGLL